MKSFKTIALIGIMIFSIMLLWSCKKNETIEPEPENNAPTITYEYDNLTTGDKTTFEINDMIYAKGIGKIAESRPYDGFVDFGIGLYEGNNNVFDITGLSTGKQREITVEGNSPLEKGILEEKEYDVKVDYTIMDANGDSTSHQLNIGSVMVTAEHGKINVNDFHSDSTYAYTILKNNIDKISTLLSSDSGIVNSNGTHPAYEQFVNGFTNLTDGNIDNNELTNIKLDDSVNRFIYTTVIGGTIYTIPESPNGEKIMYELDKLFGIK